jgi:hypothetical protein
MKRWAPILIVACVALAVGALLFKRNFNLTGGSKGRANDAITSSLSDKIPPNHRLTKSEEDRLLLGDIAKVPFQELYGLLSKRTPEEITKLAEQLQTLPRNPASDANVVAFFKTWAALDAKAALASAIALRDAHFRRAALAAVLRGADATAASAIAHSINDLPAGALSPSDKTTFLSSAVTKWSLLEPVVAAQFLDAIDAQGLDYSTAFNSTAANWASQDPAAALAWAQKHPDGYGNLAMQGAINGWWQKDPRGAEAYVASQTDTSDRQEMAMSFVDMLFRSDPVHARQWVSQLQSADARKAANSAIAQSWAQDDPEAATRWAANLPADERGNAIGGAARFWAKADPKAAGDFLDSLGGAMRDEAVGSFSISIAYEDSALALTWAATISDPSMRQKSEEVIASEWLKQNPAAARDWIQNSSLSDAEKARLLEVNPGP